MVEDTNMRWFLSIFLFITAILLVFIAPNHTFGKLIDLTLLFTLSFLLGYFTADYSLKLLLPLVAVLIGVLSGFDHLTPINLLLITILTGKHLLDIRRMLK